MICECCGQETLDPFRPAENDTLCPKCSETLGWNDEDGLEGQICGCGYVFNGTEEPTS